MSSKQQSMENGQTYKLASEGIRARTASLTVVEVQDA